MSMWSLVVLHEADFPRDPKVAVTLHGSYDSAVDALRGDFNDNLEQWSEIEREKVGVTDTDLLDTMRRYGILVFIDEHGGPLPVALAAA
jgi:hypothetical protein